MTGRVALARDLRATARPGADAGAAGRRTPLVLLFTCVMILGVSGGMLWFVGINYDGLTGAAAHKVHPATYLVVVMFGWAAMTCGNPAGYVARAAAVRPAGMLLALSASGLLLQIVLRGGPGMAGVVDTFLLPGLFVVLLADRDAGTWRRLEWLVHAVMLANGLLGLVEFGTGRLMFPYRLDGEVFASDTRSAGLQGHPLGNATLTATYVIALITGGGTLSAVRRGAMIALQLAALVAFGGRSAMVVTLVLGGGYGVRALHRVLQAGRIPLLAAAAGVLLLTLAPLGIGGLAAAGFFDQLLQRFLSDGGSANARIEMFDLVASLPLRELLVGPDPSLVDSLRRVSGLEWGIENPIVRSLVYNGAVMTALMTVTVTLFIVELARNCRPGTLPPIMAFVILINTFEGLGGKTTALAKFALLLLALYRPVREAGGDPAGPAPADRAREAPGPRRSRDRTAGSHRP